VEDAVEGSVFIGSSAKKAFDYGTIVDIGFDEFDACGDLVTEGVAKIIYHDDLMSLLYQES